MTPVEQVQEWLTAIGEKTYDAEHRERLLWGALRRLQAAMDEYHAVHEAVGKLDEPPWSGDMNARKALKAIARALCEVAYEAIGSALLRGEDLSGYNLRCTESSGETRATIEQMLYDLFRDDEGPDSCYPIREAAAFYGFGDKLEACFAEVHRANMAKLWCGVCGKSGCHIRRNVHGEVAPKFGWEPPDLGPILFGGEK